MSDSIENLSKQIQIQIHVSALWKDAMHFVAKKEQDRIRTEIHLERKTMRQK